MTGNASAADAAVVVGLGLDAEPLPMPPIGAAPIPLPPATVLSSSLRAWLGQIVARRELLFILAWREIKVKYKQSVMGFMWALLMPALVVGAGVLVKFAFASMSGKPLETSDVISVSVRSVPWAFFVASIRFSSVSLVSNANLVTKIYMPRVIFPIASVVSQLLDFVVASTVLTVFLAFVHAHVDVHLLWLPVMLAILVVLVSGLAIFLSAAALFFRDVKYIVEIVMTFAIFFSPVFYDVSTFGKWKNILLVNPVAPLLEGISASVMGRPLPFGGWVVYSTVVSLAGLVAALAFFRRAEPYFAESV